MQYSHFLIFVFLLSKIILPSFLHADSKTVQKAVASRVCEPNCQDKLPPELEEVLNLTTTGQCISNAKNMVDHGIKLAKCPEANNKLVELDNTFPTGGIFAIYTGDNSTFIFDLLRSHLENNKFGKFNLILPLENTTDILNYKELSKALNHPQVNIIMVETPPAVDRWMQDSLQFSSLDGKPALYQLAHFREHKMDLNDRLACQIAGRCKFPYYIPDNINDPTTFDEQNTLNSGGNIEVLPGKTVVLGVMDSTGKALS